MANLYDDQEREIDRALRARYYTQIRQAAVAAVEEAKDDEQLDTLVNEESERLVIYTADAIFALFESDNRDAAWDEGMVDSTTTFQDGTDYATKVAYWAIRQDIWDYLHALGDTLAKQKAAVAAEKRLAPRQPPAERHTTRTPAQVRAAKKTSAKASASRRT